MRSISNLLSIILLAAISMVFIASCSTTTDPADAYKGETPQQIYQKGRESLKDKNYAEAMKRFEALDVQYPYGAETEAAQFYLIYAYYMKEEYALSVSAADRFIRLHPTYPHVDYAYYMRGVADYYQNLGVLERLFSLDLSGRDLTQVQKSYNDFYQLVVRYPHSRYTPAAHQYLIYLRNMLAKHELRVATYYYEKGAYVASANRASELIAHYQGAPSVEPALILLIKSHHQLGMMQSEQEALKVLHLNFPTQTVNY